ncbi:MAG TPA: phosphoketolase family protein [Myxococcales bacterium]|nr:phosphoketolase family protein [Myxococcales bacterium]
MPHTLTADELTLLDSWWRAANYLTVGQIYLQANPLLREPLRPEHIKPRLLGHWGTSPGLSLLYAHLNRLIRKRDVDAIFLAGPGHGGPAVIANVWLEGTWSEIYPEVTRDGEGMRRLFRQFSTPYGVPSHVSPPVPGSINEGGELGYVLTHAFGAAFDNPDLLVLAVVGDGEAETGPLEGSWKGISFLNPARDGAVLPVLHLNGYKIANPTVLGRKSDEEISFLLRGHGYEPFFVEGDDPPRVHAAIAETLDVCYDRIRELQARARRGGPLRPRWPVIVLRTPKGWTGPKIVDGVQVEGTFRAHQVPIAQVRENPDHLRELEAWMKSYRPEELFDRAGAPSESLSALIPRELRRMSANPHANGGRILVPLDLPDYTRFAVDVKTPAVQRHESVRQLGAMLREVFVRNADERNFRIFCPDELTSNRLGAVLEATARVWIEDRIPGDDHLAPDGRVMEVLSEHNCEGWLEGYLLTGRHGLFCTYEAFAMVVASMATQHAKWLEMCRDLLWRAPIASLNVLLTSTCWRNDHNGFSHQGPGFIDTIISKQGEVARVYLPPDANCLLSVADHCLRSRSYVNLIVIDKQPQLQWLTMDQARAHCARGAGIWEWASNAGEDPDIVLGCAGDIPTLETVAAAHWLRQRAPDLRVRVVNVVDLFAIADPQEHPHGMPPDQFVQLFTRDVDVVFAWHGYANALHGILHGRQNASRFHVRGYNEEGTTTTPFDMVVLNRISRYHIVISALQRARRIPENASRLIDDCELMLRRHTAYVKEHLEDMPEIRDWTWTP